jgi:hypothetical protein
VRDPWINPENDDPHAEKLLASTLAPAHSRGA